MRNTWTNFYYAFHTSELVRAPHVTRINVSSPAWGRFGWDLTKRWTA